MSTWTWDTETWKYNEKTKRFEYVLDASGKHVEMVCIVKDTGVTKTFTNKEDARKYVIEGAKKEHKRGRKLTLYAHNQKYEYYNIMDLNDRNAKIFCESPFIASYYMDIYKEFDNKEKLDSWTRWAKMNGLQYTIEGEALGITTISYKKEIIKFLDTIALFRMSLKKMGETIGFPKLEMPGSEEDKLIIGKKVTKEKWKEIEEYCINDCKVCMEGVKYLREKLKSEGINIRHLCTINQVAISYLITELMKGDNGHVLMKNKEGKLTERTWKSYFPEEIHQAYRGGFVRVWKTGEIDNVTHIDFNSLYPYCAMEMKFPDLRTERKVKEPLKKMSLNEVLNYEGVTKCMIHNKSNELGLLMARTEGKSYVFGKGKYSIGSWTNVELREAIKEGYEILDIEYSIIYDEGINPFTDIFRKIYELRKNSGSEFDNYFYKMIMNAGIGKFAQRRVGQEILVDSIENVYKYLNKGYEMLGDIENTGNVVYINKEINNDVKKYYTPIISTLITANARVEMYRAFKKLNIKDLVYTDTDSVIAKGDFRKKFDIGNEIGQFKVEKDIVTDEELVNSKAIIWGTKCKAIGNNIGVSGVFKADLNIESFKKGEVFAKRMTGIKGTGDLSVGEFRIEARDLSKQLEEFNRSEEVLDSLMLYIDKGTEDISFFSEILKKLSDSNVLHLTPQE